MARLPIQLRTIWRAAAYGPVPQARFSPKNGPRAPDAARRAHGAVRDVRPQHRRRVGAGDAEERGRRSAAAGRGCGGHR